MRNLTLSGRRKIPGKNVYKDVKTEIIDTETMLESLGITREQLVDVCILIGTDFNHGIDGIGPKKGLKLIQKHGNLENALPAIGQEIPEYQEVRDIFLDGPKSDDYDVKHGTALMEETVDMMSGYGFSEERVRSVVNRIIAARKTEDSRKKQRSLDGWI